MLLALMLATGTEVRAQGYQPRGLTLLSPSRLSEPVRASLLGEDLSVQHLVVTANATTEDALTILGGRLRLVPYEVNANGYLYFDPSTGFYFANQVNIADGAFLTVDNVSPKRGTETFSIYGAHGVTPKPQAALDACSGAREGQITTLTTDGFAYQCNGVINTRLQGALWSEVTSLDYGNLTSHTSETLTITVTGATTNDLPECAPTGAPHEDIHFHWWMSGANTVSIRAHNDSGVDVNQAALNWQCIVFVK